MTTFREFYDNDTDELPNHIVSIVKDMSKQISMMNPLPSRTTINMRQVYVIPPDMQRKLGRGATTPPNLQWLIHGGIVVPEPATNKPIWRDGNMYIDMNVLGNTARSNRYHYWWMDRRGREQAGDQFANYVVNAMNQPGQMARYRTYGN